MSLVVITYGLERLAMFIQEKESVFDIEWVDGISYHDVTIRMKPIILTITSV